MDHESEINIYTLQYQAGWDYGECENCNIVDQEARVWHIYCIMTIQVTSVVFVLQQ